MLEDNTGGADSNKTMMDDVIANTNDLQAMVIDLRIGYTPKKNPFTFVYISYIKVTGCLFVCVSVCGY